MSYTRSGIVVLVILSLLMAWTSGAAGAEIDSQTLGHLQRRLDAQDQRIAEQDARIAAQNRRIAQLEAEKSGGPPRYEASEQDRKAEIKQIVDDIHDDAKPIVPKWLKDLTWFGDLRLRYHGETWNGSSKKDVNKGRFRLRIGAKKTWSDKQFEAGFRLASGSSDDPSSTNQSFDTNFSEKNFWIDRAYVKYKPKAIAGLEVVGGKMANPLFHTNVVWDSDVNPEGIWTKYTLPGAKPIQPFAGVGYFQSDENSSTVDGNLVAFQGGVIVYLGEDTEWTTAGTWYDWEHYDVTFDRAGNNTMAGGVLTADEFDVINITSKLKTKVGGVPVSAWFDWAHNTKNALDNGTEDAYGAGIKVGKNKKKGDLSAKYKYAYIEANASPGAFNDSDFGHSNSKGHQVGVAYNLTDFATAGLTVFYTEPVSSGLSFDSRVLALFDIIFKW